MRRIRPEKILVFGIIAPLVFGGLMLAVVGAAIESHWLQVVGFYALTVGGCIACLPLAGACVYFAWLRVTQVVRGPKKP